MVDQEQRNSPEEKNRLCELVNKALEEIDKVFGYGFQLWDYPCKPEGIKDFVPAHEPLYDKRLLYVEDTLNVLEILVSRLIVVTGGNASFILQCEESLPELVEKILANDPDVLLLDYNLEGFTAKDVITELWKRNFKGKIIGTSGDAGNLENFRDMGIPAVDKDVVEAEKMLSGIAQHIIANRRYLLGQMSDEELAAHEVTFMNDAAYEEYELVEQQLIEEYLDGALSDQEKLLFEQNYLHDSPERLEKVAIMKAVNQTIREKGDKKNS